jgi:hypothetical protein
MNTLSSYRIGSRASEANNRAASSESSVLRALFELRKTYSQEIEHEIKDDANNINNNINNNNNKHLTFWNCSWSPRILQSLRKILVRDGRRFASIKFFDCAIQSDAISSELFAEILGIIMANNSATSLVIKGGRLIGTINDNINDDSPRQHQHQQQHQHQHHHQHQHQHQQQRQRSLSCLSSLSASQASLSSASITTALREGLSTNTSLRSLKLSGLELFSSPSTVKALSDALSQNSALESLNLRECSLDDISLSQLLRSVKEHPSLTVLNLSRNYLGARTSSNTASSLLPSSTIALDAVVELLRSESSKLESLDLSHQYQQHPTTGRTNNRTTTTLNPTPKDEAEQQQIQQHKAAFGKALDALSTNTSLKRIDLAGNPGCFSDSSSAKALASCLVANTCLEHADVSRCGMTPEIISYLAKECIPFCGTSLKNLVLFGSDSDVPFSPLQSCTNSTTATTTESRCSRCHDDDSSRASASTLEKGLLYNTTLETLGDLPNSDNYGNNETETARNNNTNTNTNNIYGRIQHTLNLNKGGRRAFQQSSSSLPRAAWSQLLARAGNLDYDSHNTDGRGGSDSIINNNNNKDHKRVELSLPTASVVFALLRQGTILLEH